MPRKFFSSDPDDYRVIAYEVDQDVTEYTKPMGQFFIQDYGNSVSFWVGSKKELENFKEMLLFMQEFVDALEPIVHADSD